MFDLRALLRCKCSSRLPNYEW